MKLSKTMRERMTDLAAKRYYFQSPFNSTDYALEERGFVTLRYESARGPGAAKYRDVYYRELTDAGRAALPATEKLEPK